MSEWQRVKLGLLYEVHNGLSKPRNSFGSGFPFLSYSVVFNNFFLPERLENLVQTDEKEQASYSIQEGDIFVTRTSETAAELGMSCVALKDYPRATYNGFCKRLRPITDKVYPRYIGYFLRTPEFRSRFDGLGAAMITRASLKNEDLLSMTITLPHLPTQRKIAKVLSAYDDLIENNTKRIRILERMAEELYKEWFVRFRFPGHEKAKFVNGLPEGWNVWRVDELALINTRSLKKNSALREIKYLDTGNATRNDIGTIESFLIDEAPGRAKRLVKKNSIIYSTVRPNLEHHALLLAPPDDLVVSTGFAVLDCKWDVAVLIYMFLRQPVVVDYLSNIAEGAVSTYPSITPAEIGRLRVALPEKKVAEELNGKLYQYFTETDLLQRQNALLARQRDLLLPRLMSGKLSVEGVG